MIGRTLIVCLLGFWSLAALAVPRVEGVRVWSGPDGTRVVLDASGPLQYEISTLREPARVVLDLRRARWLADLPALPLQDSEIVKIDKVSRGLNAWRLILTLKREATPKAFLLKPYKQYRHRLVLDLENVAAPSVAPPDLAQRRQPTELVVAIDAGHGGEDPGAIGKRRTREKDVVLAIARELKRQIDATPGMRAELVRDGDYYLSLRRRIDKARRFDPDVFLSIHADAIPGRRRVQGSSVYALSERGATREAAYLAAQENAADMIGGVAFDQNDDVLNKVLVDMSQVGTIAASLELGNDLLSELRRVGPVHNPSVGQAGFYVLRSPFIPSVLIETAFISTLEEERKLNSPSFRQQLARALVAGLKRAAPRLLARRAPGGAPPTEVVQVREARTHAVKPGETLAGIAAQYGVNLELLLFANGLLEGDPIVGRVLRIPETETTVAP